MRSGRSSIPGTRARYTAEAHPLEAIALWAPRVRRRGLRAALGRGRALRTDLRRVMARRSALSQMGSVLVALPRHAWRPRRSVAARRARPDPRPRRLLRDVRRSSFLPARGGRAASRQPPARPPRGAGHRTVGPPARPPRAPRPREHEPGRLILGRAAGRLVAAESRQSAIVIGPTQTGKTTGFAIPAILEWKGPVVATSIKTDLLRETIAARSAIAGARTFVYDPTGSTGLPSDGWTPLIEGLTWQGAQRVAEWLVRGARTSGMASDAADFWYGATAKLLAPILLAAACSGGSMAQVVAWVDSMEDRASRAGARGERRAGGHQRARGHRALGRPNQRKRLRDRTDGADRLRRSRRPRLRDVSRSPRRPTSRRRLAHRVPLRACPRAAPPPAALRDARPGDHRARVRAEPPKRASRSTRRCCSSSTSAPTSRPSRTWQRSRRPAPAKASSSSRYSRTWLRSTRSTAATTPRRSCRTTARR